MPANAGGLIFENFCKPAVECSHYFTIRIYNITIESITLKTKVVRTQKLITQKQQAACPEHPAPALDWDLMLLA